MNDFEIVMDYINHTREIIGPMFSGLADIVEEYSIDEAGKALEALDRIEKDTKEKDAMILFLYGLKDGIYIK